MYRGLARWRFAEREFSCRGNACGHPSRGVPAVISTAGECRAGELAPLVGTEHPGLATKCAKSRCSFLAVGIGDVLVSQPLGRLRSEAWTGQKQGDPLAATIVTPRAEMLCGFGRRRMPSSRA
jgi:hypothetical protein